VEGTLTRDTPVKWIPPTGQYTTYDCATGETVYYTYVLHVTYKLGSRSTTLTIQTNLQLATASGLTSKNAYSITEAGKTSTQSTATGGREYTFIVRLVMTDLTTGVVTNTHYVHTRFTVSATGTTTITYTVSATCTYTQA
jgi:hypothetical protein